MDPPRLVASADQAYFLRRVAAEDLTVRTFRTEVVTAKLPVIITGLPLASGLGICNEVLRDELPKDLEVPVKVHGCAAGNAPVGEALDRIERGEDVYIADVSIANYFPWLFSRFCCPRYGLHCFSHRTRTPNFASANTPSLFVGAKDSATPLHCDQLATHFWMFCAEGRKAWTCFHPDDRELLGYEWDEQEQIRRFRPLADLAAEPADAANLAKARRLDFVLEEGEVLFIPSNTPHEVKNLTRTVAISANFWDQTNLAEALTLLEAKLGQREKAPLRTLHSSLSEIDWPALQDDVAEVADGLFPDHGHLVDAKPLNFKK